MLMVELDKLEARLLLQSISVACLLGDFTLEELRVNMLILET